MVRRMKHTYPLAIQLVEQKKVDLQSIVTHHFPFEQTPLAFDIANQETRFKSHHRFLGEVMPKYSIGVDFGTESGRAVLIDVADGKEIASSVYPYSHGVIDEKLPDSDIRLDYDWALQDPADYIRVFQNTIPAVLK